MAATLPLREVSAAFRRALRDEQPPDPPLPVLTPCPCEGCPRAQRCARELLACSAFAMFVHGRPWSGAARVDANAARYLLLGI